MQIPSDLCRYGERVLTGTGLTVAEAAALAEGRDVAAGIPEACVGALRDGWTTARGVKASDDRPSDDQAVAS